MTRVAQRKTRLTFETEATERYRQRERPIVVEADGEGFIAAFRLKGTRVRYEASWLGLFHFAAKLAAAKARVERKARRQAQGEVR